MSPDDDHGPSDFLFWVCPFLSTGAEQQNYCANLRTVIKVIRKYIYITLFDWWKWDVIENLSLPHLDNKERVRGEEVSSVRQRYCSSRLGEVKEREQKSHTTAGCGSSRSCSYGHTSAGRSAGDYGRVKTLLLHQPSQMTVPCHSGTHT